MKGGKYLWNQQRQRFGGIMQQHKSPSKVDRGILSLNEKLRRGPRRNEMAN